LHKQNARGAELDELGRDERRELDGGLDQTLRKKGEVCGVGEVG
jgi:hypothetical protein